MCALSETGIDEDALFADPAAFPFERPLLSSAQGDIAFQAGRATDFGPVQAEFKVPFPEVQLNKGNGYSVTASQFYAPVAGIYHLSTSVQGKNSSYVKIVTGRNGDGVAACRSHHGTSTTSIVVELEVQEAAWVLLTPEADALLTCDSSAKACTFSGVLLYALESADMREDAM